MKKEKLSKNELEQICVEEGIILERTDSVTNSTFFVPNLKKIRIMISEFEFLVEGAARGKAINKISDIELFLHGNENNSELQKIHLATNYSSTSIFLESKSDIISDRKSENWENIIIQYFSLQEIYNYFHKTGGASNFFRSFNIYKEMIELTFRIKLMEYLQDQIEIYNPSSENKVIPYKINALEMVLLIFQKLGTLDALKKNIKGDYYENASKLLTALLKIPKSNWNQINSILWDIDHNSDDSILADTNLKSKLKDILFYYKIDLR